MRLRIRTIFIVTRVTVLDRKYQKHDRADQRDESDEQPPAGPTRVVQTPDHYGDARKQNTEGVEIGQYALVRVSEETSEAFYQPKPQAYQNIEQIKKPVL